MLADYNLSAEVRAFAEKTHQLWIDGQWVEPQAKSTFDVYDPASGEVLCKVAAAQQADVDQAVAAARQALKGKWSTLSPSRRARMLWNVSELIEKYADELTQLESLDVGKPLMEAKYADVAGAAEQFRYFAGWTNKFCGEVLPVAAKGFLTYTRREPVGVVGAITAWNFPMLLSIWKIAPALATGNTVVLKPSEVTPLTCLRLAEIIKEAGIPDGVVNVVPGLGTEAGSAISKHPGINKVSFTGSPRVGRQLLIDSAENFKRVTLELGGKSPNIVLDDADIDVAVKGAMSGIFFNQGEFCAAGSRLFVPKDKQQQMLDGIAAGAEKLASKQGPGIVETSRIGPLVSQEHMDRVLGYIKTGNDEGAELVTGGTRNESAGGGYFVTPTVFAGNDELTIAKEEIFGPVLTVLPYESLEEVAERANNTEYGLAAGVWTSDVRKGIKLANQLEAGTVWVNGYNVFDAASPWGGYKTSGIGREMGRYALESYTEVKSIWVNLEE